MKLKSLSQKDRYGNMFSFEFFEPDTSIPMMMVIPDMADGYNGADTDNHPGNPKGTDTVPAWLTPGENVVNAEASRIPGNQEIIDEMNDEGRAIQEAQGGPIPTYQDAGGIIQGVTDFFTMPTPPPGSGIKYRRHKDGSIGMWAGNTFRGYYKKPAKKESSFSEKLGISYNAEGSTVPAYAAGGMEIPRPDGMLNSLGNRLKEKDGGPMYAYEGTLADFLRKEEGLRNTAYRDAAGVPTVGYGSTYGVKMGDQLSDAEANRKLMADIAVAEEDYNNLVDVELNPYQQKAVKSLLFNIGGPQFANSKARAALNAGDFETFQKEASEFRMADGKVLPGLEARRAREMAMFNYFPEVLTERGVSPSDLAQADQEAGIISAQAQTTVPPVNNNAPPVLQATKDRARNAKIKAAREHASEFASPPPKREIPIEADQGGDSFGDPAYNELFAPPLPGGSSRMEGLSPETTNKFGVPKRKLPKGEGVGITSKESLGKQGLRNKVTEADKDIETAKKELEKIQKQIEVEKASPEGVSAGTVQKGKAAVKKLENAEKTKAGVEKDINELDAAEALVEEEKNADADEILEMKPATVPEEAKKPPSKTNNQKDAAQSVLDSIPNKGVVTPEIELEIQDFVESYYDGRQTPDSKFQETVDTAAGWFKDTFKSMFSGPEFARMVVTYAGSRMLGYDHGGSLQYSMKNYIDRIDAREKQYQKDIRGKDYQDFTQASRDKFEETRDYADLKKKKTKVGMESIVGQKYLAGVPLANGKMFSGVVQLIKMTDDTQAYELPNGQTIPISHKSVRGRAATLNPNLHDRIKVKENFLSALDREAKRVNARVKDDDADKTSKKLFITDALANQATNELFKAYNTYGARPEGQTALAQVMSKAITKWADDSAKFLQTGEGLDVTGNLTAYFNRERIIDDYKISPKSLEGTDAKVAANLINRVARFSDDSETDAKRDWAESERIFNKALADKSIPKYGFDAEQPENSGYSKFTWWLSQIYADEANEKAVQLLNNVIAKEKKGA